MDLKTLIQNDMKTSMKAQDSLKTNALRMLISEVKKREIDKREPLTETEIQKAIQTLLKQRQESVEAFTKGGRQDLADKELLEIAVLKVYLPQQLSREEVEGFVTIAIQETGATGPNDLGKVMKVALEKTAGRADGKLVSELVRAKLAK